MPLYEFKCVDCSALFERLVPVSTFEYICPICGKSCKKIISQIAPPVIKSSTPYSQNITMSPKEIDHRVGEVIDTKIRPIFEEREKEKQAYRHNVGEVRLKRLPKDNPGDMEYVPVGDDVVENRKKMLKEFSSAIEEHKKERTEKGLSQFEDEK